MDFHRLCLIFLTGWFLFWVLHFAVGRPSKNIAQHGSTKRSAGGNDFFLKSCEQFYDCNYGQTCDTVFKLCVQDLRESRKRSGGYFPTPQCASDYDCYYNNMECDHAFGFCVRVSKEGSNAM